MYICFCKIVSVTKNYLDEFPDYEWIYYKHYVCEQCESDFDFHSDFVKERFQTEVTRSFEFVEMTFKLDFGPVTFNCFMAHIFYVSMAYLLRYDFTCSLRV